mmetsp:Transcript_23589/g.51996  ORF Transcript_23589/g.51996 Transcript_23589/m.51996 type:complete len:126 (-) Transcript_23589:45-422(-)
MRSKVWPLLVLALSRRMREPTRSPCPRADFVQLELVGDAKEERSCSLAYLHSFGNPTGVSARMHLDWLPSRSPLVLGTARFHEENAFCAAAWRSLSHQPLEVQGLHTSVPKQLLSTRLTWIASCA